MWKKLVSLLGILVLAATIATPAVGATDTDTIVGTEVYYQTGMSWSGVNSATLVRTVSPTAGGATPSVLVTIPWDGLATANMIIVNQFSGIHTNTGDTQKFTEAMGSVFYGEGSYHTFSDPTGEGYDKYWISPTTMYVTSGRSGTTVTTEYSLTIYAESKAEAEAKIKAGFEALGIGAEVSVIASQTVGTKVEYTVKVTTSLYKYYYTTEYIGTIWRHYHVESNSNFIPTSLDKGSLITLAGNSYDRYDSRDFSFVKRFTFYSYEDVDVNSLSHYGQLTT